MMMHFSFQLVVTTFLLIIIIFFQLCHSFHFGKHLATKTPYPLFENVNNYTQVPHGCRILHINYLGRHGSRAPTANDMNRLTILQSTIQSHKHLLKNPNFSWMVNWVNPYIPEQAGNLEVLGEVEQYTIAKRFAILYNITTPTVDNAYPIQTTMIPRASRSGNAFGFGLFEGKGVVGPDHFKPFYLFSESLDHDITLRFFDNCPLYLQRVLNSEVAVAEYIMFENEQLSKVAFNVSKRLGVFPLWNISVDELDAMYTACTFEYSKSNTTNRWCSLFTEEEFLTFEYAEDLFNYWTKGYGHELNFQIACPLLKEILTIMESKINRSDDFLVELGRFRFAHAETLLPLISLIGLYRDDEPLRARSSPQFIQNRKWRTSLISPYAANIAFILYECNSTSSTSSSPFHLVKLLHNEKEIFIPGCENSIYCPYSTFKSRYWSSMNCNFEQLCGIQHLQCVDSSKTRFFGWFDLLIAIGSFGLGLAFSFVFFIKRKCTNNSKPSPHYEHLK